MPVFKFRSLQEAERALWLPAGDERLKSRLGNLWYTAWILAGRFGAPRGVYKFRSIEEANAHREAWVRRRIERLRAQRQRF